jgi:hypothetical protein
MKTKLTDEARKSELAKLSGWSEVAGSDVASRVSETPYAVSVRMSFARIVVHRSARLRWQMAAGGPSSTAKPESETRGR